MIAEDRDVLVPGHGWFTEDLDTDVPNGVKVPLDEL